MASKKGSTMKTRIRGTKPEAKICSRTVSRMALVVSGMLVSGVVAGADATSWNVHPYLQDRWTIQLGVFYPDVSTTARLDNSALQRGTEVDFEDDLDLTDRKALGSILASVRLGERWRIEAEYFALNRSGTRAIGRTINWGDNTFTVGSVVSSTFDSDIYRLSAGYAFIKDKESELGVALGLFTTDFKASLAASGIGASAGDVLAPLPTIGVYGAHAFTPRWLLQGRVDYFTLNYDEYDGSLTNLWVAVDYRFARHFGVGAGYRYVDYSLDVTKNSWHGNIDYKFQGPMLYVVASF